MHRVHRYVTNDFAVRVSAVNAVDVIHEMQTLQKMKPIPAVGVGRLMVSTLLMASNLREGQEVGILIKGNGLVGTLFAEASYDGKTRGYTPFANFDPGHIPHRIELKEYIGAGFLNVSRHQPFQKSPHHGTVALVYGEVAEDLCYYLKQSLQVQSFAFIEVGVDQFGEIKSGGGLLVEAMPGVNKDLIDKIEEHTKIHREAIYTHILQGKEPMDYVPKLLEGLPFTELDHNFPIEYHCQCTYERVMSAMSVLGVDTLDDMVKEAQDADVTCQMCGKPYKISFRDLKELRDKIKRESLH